MVRRRRGLPITLSVLGMEVGRRVGLRLEGVGLPGHFLLRHGPDAYVDPFDGGRELDRAGCLERFRAVNGPRAAFLPSYLDPVGPLAILARMLNNLKSVYAGRGDVTALSWVFDLRSALPQSSALERREWAQVLGLTGRFLEAAQLMEALAGELPDHEESLVAEADAMRARLNCLEMPKPTEADKERFRSLVPDDPRVEVKPMFGNLGAFVNGNMFMGLFGAQVGLKLDEADRATWRPRAAARSGRRSGPWAAT